MVAEAVIAIVSGTALRALILSGYRCCIQNHSVSYIYERRIAGAILLLKTHTYCYCNRCVVDRLYRTC
ncbi:hypothetical protein BURKHO8Y_140363 [Burkholderia sp. 8Y]|nr:hypothetical protein BURKHO8Y_140363 [Burkholderia sp. 8Y]